jgi:hypothetical protein
MSTTFSLELPVPTKDLRLAIAAFLDAWRTAEPQATTSVHVLLQTTHWEPLRRLAARLPANLRGFRSLTGENLTAREILAVAERTEGRNPPAGLAFGGEIVPPLAVPALVGLLAEIQALEPDPLRRTSLGLAAKGLRWRGADASSQGRLELFDAKVFSRKVRFHLAATLEFADGIDAAGIERQLRRIAAANGLDFARGKRQVTTPAPQPGAAELAWACMLFDDCVEAVSQDLLADGFDWRSLAGACANGEGAARRFSTYGQTPASPPLRLETRLNRFMREQCPDFKKRGDTFANAHAYAAALDSEWDLAVIFDTHPGRGIGKVFKIRVGLLARRGRLASFQRSAPMLRCAGGMYSPHQDACPEFTFNTEGELDRLLADLGPFLADFRSRFRGAFERSFRPDLDRPEGHIPVHGNLTCKGALAIARAHLAVAGRGELPLHRARLFGTVDNLHYRLDPAAQLPPDGRLTPWHGWDFDFIDGGATSTVGVPFAGRPRASSRESYLMRQQPGPELVALPEPWLDSSEIAAEFFAKLRECEGRYPDMKSAAGLLSLSTEDGLPSWSAQLEFASSPGTSGWVLVRHAVDARDGRPIATSFDERFPDRARTREIKIERHR